MTDHTNDQNNKHNTPQWGRYTRFMELEGSLFPDNEGDFASSFMNPRRPRDQSDQPAPFGNRVWTGEAFVYAPPPRPEEQMDFDSYQNPSLRQSGMTEVPGSAGILPGSPHVGGPSYLGNPQGSGSARQQDKDKFQFVGWNDEAKRMLYRWKRILKKGPSFFLHQFPGETEASLRDAWDKYGEEGKRLYEEWEAAQEEE
ncbi:hypothetical protein COCMIDRAFT_33193 [Bipolaris oryzae ATCC 44560]|uniref:Uncharacterized protein n=1 Tax=Bipolaris oryzae ATCC 44560 TaxID=930090 RepID=W6ZHE9_COCMI|nr:uncharacterized protein COCMIDRAFT_33193 [Bipolaris oryzae ATCC 44560]EUC49343.1 hypothetical protein COCMIDRAFT_33193 [Bipolaris oryzae ATCC 44560]